MNLRNRFGNVRTMTFSVMKHKALPSMGNPEGSGQSLTCAEYFAGIGLVRLGLEQAGWKVVFANDWAQDKFEMYAAHFEDASTHYRVVMLISLIRCWLRLHFPASIYLWRVT
jgi:DNA (cytosine-5)-methyltransferase 1